MATAAASWSRSTTACSRAHAAAGSSVGAEFAPPVSASASSNSTLAAIANVAEAFASCGNDRSRSATDARSAGPINFEAINTANRSNASSIALLCNSRAVASNVADRRAEVTRRMFAASTVNPARAKACNRLGGTSDTSTRSAPKPPISAARSSARTISRPDARVGARRSRSSSDPRAPNGRSATCPAAARARPIPGPPAGSRADPPLQAGLRTPAAQASTHPAAAPSGSEATPPLDRTTGSAAPDGSRPAPPGTPVRPAQPRRSRGSPTTPGSPTNVPAASCPRGVTAHQPVDLGRRRDLISDLPHHSERSHRPIGQERPQEPDGPQLHREPDPVVIPRRTCTRWRSASSRKKNRSSSGRLGSPSNCP